MFIHNNSLSRMQEMNSLSLHSIMSPPSIRLFDKLNHCCHHGMSLRDCLSRGITHELLQVLNCFLEVVNHYHVLVTGLASFLGHVGGHSLEQFHHKGLFHIECNSLVSIHDINKRISLSNWKFVVLMNEPYSLFQEPFNSLDKLFTSFEDLFLFLLISFLLAFHSKV